MTSVPPVPAIRKRFVARARHLATHPPFVTATAAATEKWGADYPAFAFTRGGVPPDRHPDPGDTPLPSALHAAIMAANGRHIPSAPAVDRETTFAAALTWTDLTLALAREWWPEEYYPAWPWPGLTHPALPFVGACLIWPPVMVPEEWVDGRVLTVRGLPYDPFEPSANPAVVFARAQHAALLHDLHATLGRGETITPAWLDAAALRAAMRGADASCAAFEAGERGYYEFVPVFPGMATTEWRALEAPVRRGLARTDDWLRDHARHLAGTGMSTRQIAGLLGISRQKVARMLHAA